MSRMLLEKLSESQDTLTRAWQMLEPLSWLDLVLDADKRQGSRLLAASHRAAHPAFSGVYPVRIPPAPRSRYEASFEMEKRPSCLISNGIHHSGS